MREWKGREEKLVALGCNGKKEEQDNPTTEIKTWAWKRTKGSTTRKDYWLIRLLELGWVTVVDMATRKSPEIRDLRWGWLHFPSPTEMFYLWSRLSLLTSYRFLMKMSQLQNPTAGPCYIKYNRWILPSFPLGWCFSIWERQTNKANLKMRERWAAQGPWLTEVSYTWWCVQTPSLWTAGAWLETNTSTTSRGPSPSPNDPPQEAGMCVGGQASFSSKAMRDDGWMDVTPEEAR